MRKNIVLLLMLTVVPYALCLVFSIFCDEIQIGQGDREIESHLLNKNILLEIDGLYKSMDVEEYILGVLPGTIPADYDEETLKVQAILIRTNVLKEMEEKGTSDAADLSYDYLTMEERIDLFGERNYERYQERFESAVVDTAGMVLRQEGALVMALYHEVSIGKTISAKELLGEDISYLQSVDSSWDVEARHYMNVVNYSWQELQDLLKEMQKAESQQEEQKEEKEVQIKVEEYTENGYATKVSVDGNMYTGEELMEVFKLTSTNFYVEMIEGGLRFVCLGKGSGLGVSQYGANRMAMEGKSWKEILCYYLKGVSVEKY